MSLRSGHGKGRGAPRVEVLPVDELPAGVRGPAKHAANRDASGKLRPGPGTSALARRAALAKQEAAAIGRLAGLWEAPEGHAFQPYQRLAREWRERHLAELAATVGGGKVGPGPASIVATAAMQLGASRWLHDRGAETGDAKMLLDASRLANDSRQNLLAAHELCAREATARPKRLEDAPWLQSAGGAE